jgi:hypothetical protein
MPQETLSCCQGCRHEAGSGQAWQIKSETLHLEDRARQQLPVNYKVAATAHNPPAQARRAAAAVAAAAGGCRVLLPTALPGHGSLLCLQSTPSASCPLLSCSNLQTSLHSC